jgi:hypothetical protein
MQFSSVAPITLSNRDQLNVIRCEATSVARDTMNPDLAAAYNAMAAATQHVLDLLENRVPAKAETSEKKRKSRKLE